MNAALAPSVRSPCLVLEELESRLAPATFVDAATVTYKDPDGDLVQIRLSEPLLVDAATADQVCHFDVGSVDGSNATRQQLQELNLSTLGVDGLDVAVTVARRSGNGRADLGYLNAAGFDLGDVRIEGDLGRIDAGAGFFGHGVSSLTVRSIGRQGLGTQAPGGLHESFVQGRLGKLEVGSDIVDSSLLIDGELPQAHIGGSVVRSQLVASPIGRMIVDGDLLGDAMQPTRIAGIGHVFQVPQTVFHRVTERVVRQVTVPESVANQLGNLQRPLTQAELDALLAKLGRRPPSGRVVQIEVTTEVTRLVAQTVLVTRRTKAIEQLAVGGSVENASILANFGSDLGTIQVNGAFRASNISAGIDPGVDGLFGTSDDRSSFTGSVLEKVTIGGPIEGTPGPDDNFGIVAGEIKSATIGRKTLRLTAGQGNDDFALGGTNDVRLREAAPPSGGFPAP